MQKEGAMDAIRDIAVLEGQFSVRSLRSERELHEAYRLRHKVYSEALKWVPSSHDELEVDDYDSIATSLGLFAETGVLVGVIRLVPAPGPFMLEKEFTALMPGHDIRKERDTNEITRLTVDPTLTDKGLSSRMLLVLLKGMYQWLVANEVRYSYMVIEKRFQRVLNLIGFPARSISPYIALPPAGALSVAALLDWEEFRVENSKKRPEFLEWMSTVSRNVSPLPAEPPGKSAPSEPEWTPVESYDPIRLQEREDVKLVTV
jgi:acyl homoserine lactone synthase